MNCAKSSWKALLPLKQDDSAIPTDNDGPGGIRLGGLERRMRGRWQTVNAFWETNKAPANQLNLLGQIDYLHKLSSQLEWQQDSRRRPIRVAYASSGTPTAAVIVNDESLVDYTLFWIVCRGIEEASYILAVINSDALYGAVQSLMPKGLFGARHLQKHLWRLPIPEFDPGGRNCIAPSPLPVQRHKPLREIGWKNCGGCERGRKKT